MCVLVEASNCILVTTVLRHDGHVIVEGSGPTAGITTTAK